MTELDPRTPEGIAALARLARLALDPEEARAFGDHMGRMLRWIESLPPARPDLGEALAGPPRRTLRADRVRPSLPPEESLAGAPERAAGGFRVPAVLPGE
ncbi:MAG: aspartyl/glutamyl-tRNA amidotransferase subunit C [Planctomycetota bacterium]|nr:MAG: aspartyl/glutamyl-tRNA amidotransferase subunit C [Planctomycetota bacterium]